ncbi:MAG: thiamine phosphate synthase [Candidatus Dormibacteraceae bacterium]
MTEAHLYAITPDSSPEDILQLSAAYLRGGVDILQLRSKQLRRPELLELARKLHQLTASAGALLIINDHLDIALLAGADGVHLGAEDLSLRSARSVAGEGLLIGASASTPQAAQQAISEGADYLGSGPVYAAPLKPEKAIIGPIGVAEIQAVSSVPVFAIGGINRLRCKELRAAGVDRICVIRALAESAQPEVEARLLQQELRN